MPKSSMQTTPVKIQATAQSTPQLASHPAAHSTTVHPMTLAAPGTPPYTGNPAPLDLALDIHVAEQVRLLTEIIHMMVGIEVELSSAAWPPPGEDLVEAVVRFAGPWPGAMIFESTLPLSFEFTARFMTVPLPEAIDDDVRDAHGELANMIAGNFKALLPAGSRLSIPEVRLRLHGSGQGTPDRTHEHSADRNLDTGSEQGGCCSLSRSVFHTAYGGCCLMLQNTSAKT